MSFCHGLSSRLVGDNARILLRAFVLSCHDIRLTILTLLGYKTYKEVVIPQLVRNSLS